MLAKRGLALVLGAIVVGACSDGAPTTALVGDDLAPERIDELVVRSVTGHSQTLVGEEAEAALTARIDAVLESPERLREVYRSLELDPEARLAKLRHLRGVLASPIDENANDTEPGIARATSSPYPWTAAAYTDAGTGSFIGSSVYHLPSACFGTGGWSASCLPWDLDHDMDISVSVDEEQIIDRTEADSFQPDFTKARTYSSSYNANLPLEGWRATALQFVAETEWSIVGPTETRSDSSFDRASFDGNGNENSSPGEPSGGSNCHMEWWTIYVNGAEWYDGPVWICDY